MKKYIFCLILVLSVTIGCVSMPDPVNESYLIDKTKNEESTLESIEGNIIKARGEIGTAKESLEKAEKKLTISRGQLNILGRKKSLLEEEQKQAIRLNDADEAEKITSQIQENNNNIEKQNLHFKFSLLSRDSNKLNLKIKENELASSVAQLNYEKAKIADKFLKEKNKKLNKGKKKEEKSWFSRTFGGSDEESIELARYKSYYNNLKTRLKRNRDEFQNLQGKLKKAESDYNNYNK